MPLRGSYTLLNLHKPESGIFISRIKQQRNSPLPSFLTEYLIRVASWVATICNV